VSYLSASAVVIHYEEALYQVYENLPCTFYLVVVVVAVVVVCCLLLLFCWKGKGRYSSFRMRMKCRVCR